MGKDSQVYCFIEIHQLESIRHITIRYAFKASTCLQQWKQATHQGYLIAVAGTDPHELRDHQSPYEFAKGQVPLEDTTIESLQGLYDTRRTRHYYGTTVTTKTQAERMHAVANQIHSHIVSFDHDLQAFCQCSEGD